MFTNVENLWPSLHMGPAHPWAEPSLAKRYFFPIIMVPLERPSLGSFCSSGQPRSKVDEVTGFERWPSNPQSDALTIMPWQPCVYLISLILLSLISKVREGASQKSVILFWSVCTQRGCEKFCLFTVRHPLSPPSVLKLEDWNFAYTLLREYEKTSHPNSSNPTHWMNELVE